MREEDNALQHEGVKVGLIEQILSWQSRKQSSSDARGKLAIVRFAYEANRPVEIVRLLGEYMSERKYKEQVSCAGLTALFAELQNDSFQSSFGASCRLHSAALRVGQNSFDLRMKALLEAPLDNALVMLRSILSQLVNSERRIPVSFYRLYNDVCNWNREDSRVQERWSREYWIEYNDDSQQPKGNENEEDTSVS